MGEPTVHAWELLEGCTGANGGELLQVHSHEAVKERSFAMEKSNIRNSIIGKAQIIIEEEPHINTMYNYNQLIGDKLQVSHKPITRDID